MATMFWKKVAQTVIDAADVDLRRFQAHLLDQMQSQPAGQTLKGWAHDNPVAFEVLIRALSIVVKKSVRSFRDQGMIAESVADQLAALPYEFRRAFTTSKAESQPRLSAPPPASDSTNFALSLQDAIATIQVERNLGEFLGAIARESVRQLKSADFDRFVREKTTWAQEHIARSLSPPSSIFHQDRLELNKAMLLEMGGGLSNAAGLTGTNVRELEAFLDDAQMQDLLRECRIQRTQSLVFALNAPSTHSPQLEERERLFPFAGSILEYLSHHDPDSFSELIQAKSKFSQIRSTWITEHRPSTWIEFLDQIEQLL